MNDADFYDLLGLESSATEGQIRKAFRTLSLRYHPDKNPSDDAAVKFHQLQVAIDTLLDESKRQQYDQKRQAKVDQIRRTQQKSKERQQMQQDLERREAVARQAKQQQPETEKPGKTTGEIRKSGFQRRQEYNERNDEDARTVKLTLSSAKSEAQLTKELEAEFGRVEHMLVGKKYAIVVFKDQSAALKFKRNDPSKRLDREYAMKTLDRLRKAAAQDTV